MGLSFFCVIHNDTQELNVLVEVQGMLKTSSIIRAAHH